MLQILFTVDIDPALQRSKHGPQDDGFEMITGNTSLTIQSLHNYTPLQFLILN